MLALAGEYLGLEDLVYVVFAWLLEGITLPGRPEAPDGLLLELKKPRSVDRGFMETNLFDLCWLNSRRTGQVSQQENLTETTWR